MRRRARLKIGAWSVAFLREQQGSRNRARAGGGGGQEGGGEGSVLSSPAGGLACRASFLAPFSSPGTRRSDGHDIRVGDRRTMKEALF
jgi:hypothetical protein